jgi:Protein of unknown function (DUF3565)
MNRPIVGYHQDAEQHWVAELGCGHNQHVRHDPPWTNRPWVVTLEGRAQKLGALLPCKKCDEGAPRDWAPVTDLPLTEDPPYLGDMVLLAADLNPTEAHILASCLSAAGIHAATGDTDTVQTHQLWAIALGGAKIRVPTSQLAEAQAVLTAFQAGELSLSDDFDVGSPSS